jgi:hypothetical protein
MPRSHRPNRIFLPLGLALAFLVGARSARAEVARPAPLAGWAGTFAYAGGTSERAALEHAIERATDSMGPLARRIARNRLESEMRPDPRIVVRVDGPMVGIGAEGTWRTILDGPARTFDEDGDHYRVVHRSTAQGVLQVIEGDSVRILKTYALSRDGTRMRVSVTFAHERLPQPIHFVLTYRRAS